MRRYFSTTLMGGILYADGIGERGPWDAKHLPYQDESVVEVLVARAGHRKVVTANELLEVLRESEAGLPAIRTWAIEGLEEFARGLWEKAQTR